MVSLYRVNELKISLDKLMIDLHVHVDEITYQSRRRLVLSRPGHYGGETYYNPRITATKQHEISGRLLDLLAKIIERDNKNHITGENIHDRNYSVSSVNPILAPY